MVHDSGQRCRHRGLEQGSGRKPSTDGREGDVRGKINPNSSRSVRYLKRLEIDSPNPCPPGRSPKFAGSGELCRSRRRPRAAGLLDGAGTSTSCGSASGITRASKTVVFRNAIHVAQTGDLLESQCRTSDRSAVAIPPDGKRRRGERKRNRTTSPNDGQKVLSFACEAGEISRRKHRHDDACRQHKRVS